MTGVSEQEHHQTKDELSLNFKLGDESFESLGNIGRKGTVHIMNSSSAMEQYEHMEDLLMANPPENPLPKPVSQRGLSAAGSDQVEVQEVADQTLKNNKFRQFQTKVNKAVFDVRIALKDRVLALHIQVTQHDQQCDVASELDVVMARNGLALSWLSEHMVVHFFKQTQRTCQILSRHGLRSVLMHSRLLFLHQ